jgi:hypothetical protein
MERKDWGRRDPGTERPSPTAGDRRGRRTSGASGPRSSRWEAYRHKRLGVSCPGDPSQRAKGVQPWRSSREACTRNSSAVVRASCRGSCSGCTGSPLALASSASRQVRRCPSGRARCRRRSSPAAMRAVSSTPAGSGHPQARRMAASRNAKVRTALGRSDLASTRWTCRRRRTDRNTRMLSRSDRSGRRPGRSAGRCGAGRQRP